MLAKTFLTNASFPSRVEATQNHTALRGQFCSRHRVTYYCKVHLKFDLLHIIGYVGALGSLVFGANQLRIILSKKEARDVSVFDYVVRVIYSVLLGIYSIGLGEAVFIVVNFGAAVLSTAVAVAALVEKRRRK